MLRPNAFAKVAGPAAILLAVGWTIWLWPAHFLWVYPASGALFLWFSWSGEREVKYIFLFLVTAAGFILPKLSPEGGSLFLMAGAIAEVLCLWLLFYALSRFESSRAAARYRLAEEEGQAAERVRGLEDELARYRLHLDSTLARIRDKGALSAAMHDMGSASAPDEVKARLETLLRKYFPGAAVELRSGAPRDFADHWVAERKIPLLVRNSDADTRFSRGQFAAGERSFMALPLYLFGNLVGFVRASAPEPDRFKAEDLRGAELACTLAGVSMENIYLYEKVRELAIKDGLTGLYTHRAFQGRVEEEILRAARSKVPFSVIMADIDHFKSYNDNFGHQAGDTVLKAVAEVFSRGVRDIDFACRYGGEEFALVITGAGRQQAAAVAEGLRAALEARAFNFGGRPSRVTASFGVAEFPADGAAASQLVRASDERLYRAKEGGRNKVVAQ
ncbi:MAG: sensor domain-containing diguanylate cyclase [Elusimicrobiales bacterium]|nr:sensor domain-containing diguanylate cyclase [Elusimicrobiales bacterium]